jgi:hypothetical protein
MGTSPMTNEDLHTRVVPLGTKFSLLFLRAPFTSRPVAVPLAKAQEPGAHFRRRIAIRLGNLVISEVGSNRFSVKRSFMESVFFQIVVHPLAHFRAVDVLKLPLVDTLDELPG